MHISKIIELMGGRKYQAEIHAVKWVLLEVAEDGIMVLIGKGLLRKE